MKDAAPSLTAFGAQSVINAGHDLGIHGTLSNVVPGTPPLAGKTVQLLAQPTNDPGAPFTKVAKATTDSAGKYAISYVPQQNATYEVHTNAFTQLENSDLNFSDKLQAQTTALREVDVQAAVSNTKATSNSPGFLRVTGDLMPAVIGDNAHLSLYARPAGDTSNPTFQSSRSLAAGATSFDLRFPLAAGKWDYQVRYVNGGVIDDDYSSLHTVTVH